MYESKIEITYFISSKIYYYTPNYDYEIQTHGYGFDHAGNFFSIRTYHSKNDSEKVYENGDLPKSFEHIEIGRFYKVNGLFNFGLFPKCPVNTMDDFVVFEPHFSGVSSVNYLFDDGELDDFLLYLASLTNEFYETIHHFDKSTIKLHTFDVNVAISMLKSINNLSLAKLSSVHHG
jgi:hypothetical protein